MKSHIKTIGLAAILSLVVSAGYAADAAGGVNTEGVCELVRKFGDIFKILRTFAFVGAAFTMASWAWGFISGGKVDKPLDEVKTKGLSLLVGTALLFGVGVIITLLLGFVNDGTLCETTDFDW